MTDEAPKRYQDYVIRDGKMVGDFDAMYKAVDDPWRQSDPANVLDSRRQLAIHWVQRLKAQGEAQRVVELGCGFGHITGYLCRNGLSAVGIDISEEAVVKARTINPGAVFLRGRVEDSWILTDLDPDVVIMAEVTWYVLDQLDELIASLKKWASGRSHRPYLVHLLSTYPPGVQKYGAEKFTNEEQIRAYFGLEYLEWGEVHSPKEGDPLSRGTYFVARL